VRALGEEADANQAELERCAMAYDDPGCPPDIFEPDEQHPSQRHNRADRDRQERDDRDDRGASRLITGPDADAGPVCCPRRVDQPIVTSARVTPYRETDSS
jgi:hypothetical protein